MTASIPCDIRTRRAQVLDDSARMRHASHHVLALAQLPDHHDDRYRRIVLDLFGLS
jgi:hypothetical protein